MTTFAIVGARVFDGERMLDNHAVLVNGGQIAELRRIAALSPSMARREAKGLLAPGFIDVQVNGGGGVLFNDAATEEGIRAIGEAHRKFGTTGFLPTLITDAREKMSAAIGAVREGLAARIPGLLGLHLEGPFISREFKGAHPQAHIRIMTDVDVDLITSLGEGRTFVTLSPESAIVSPDQITRLADAGVIVAAGHTGADYETMVAARQSGVKGYTHLFNAMPDLKKRAPGPVGAALDDRDSWCSIIADMHHVSAPVLRAALAARGAERTMLITDAMPVTGTELTRFNLGGQTVHRRNGRLEFSAGTLAGADLDMAAAVRNASDHLGVDLATALRMASRAPAEFLGLDDELGRLAPGYRADMVLLDDSLQVTATWIDGVEKRP